MQAVVDRAPQDGSHRHRHGVRSRRRRTSLARAAGGTSFCENVTVADTLSSTVIVWIRGVVSCTKAQSSPASDLPGDASVGVGPLVSCVVAF